MLQFVSNQVGEFPDLFSEQLCGTFQSSGGGSAGGTLDHSLQSSYSQAQLQSFPSTTASPQLQPVQVKVPQATAPAPQRSAPLLQPRPQLQPQLQQQTVMITPTFSSAPQTRFIQQPLIYQNAATSFQGSAWGLRTLYFLFCSHEKELTFKENLGMMALEDAVCPVILIYDLVFGKSLVLHEEFQSK